MIKKMMEKATTVPIDLQLNKKGKKSATLANNA
jgi:hypothetical protein